MYSCDGSGNTALTDQPCIALLERASGCSRTPEDSRVEAVPTELSESARELQLSSMDAVPLNAIFEWLETYVACNLSSVCMLT